MKRKASTDEGNAEPYTVTISERNIYKIDRHNIRLPSNRGARALFHDLELFNRMKHELNTESRHPFLPFKIWVEDFNRLR